MLHIIWDELPNNNLLVCSGLSKAALGLQYGKLHTV